MRKLIMKLCMIWLAFFVAFSMQKERAQAAVTEVEPMTVGSLKTAAGAQDFSYSGICGDGLTWTFKEEMLTGASYA